MGMPWGGRREEGKDVDDVLFVFSGCRGTYRGQLGKYLHSKFIWRGTCTTTATITTALVSAYRGLASNYMGAGIKEFITSTECRLEPLLVCCAVRWLWRRDAVEGHAMFNHYRVLKFIQAEGHGKRQKAKETDNVSGSWWVCGETRRNLDLWATREGAGGGQRADGEQPGLADLVEQWTRVDARWAAFRHRRDRLLFLLVSLLVIAWIWLNLVVVLVSCRGAVGALPAQAWANPGQVRETS